MSWMAPPPPTLFTIVVNGEEYFYWFVCISGDNYGVFYLAFNLVRMGLKIWKLNELEYAHIYSLS